MDHADRGDTEQCRGHCDNRDRPTESMSPRDPADGDHDRGRGCSPQPGRPRQLRVRRRGSVRRHEQQPARRPTSQPREERRATAARTPTAPPHRRPRPSPSAPPVRQSDSPVRRPGSPSPQVPRSMACTRPAQPPRPLPNRRAVRASRDPAAHHAIEERSAADQRSHTPTVRSPTSAPRPGSSTSSRTAPAARAGTAARARPVASATNPSAPVAAARSTLGDGRTRITNPTSETAQRTAVATGPARHQRATRTTTPRIIATFAPQTASRCVIPVVRKESATAGSSRVVSPSTKPGSSPRTGSGRSAHARCNPARNDPATRCDHGGRPMQRRCGVVDKSAADRSPGSGGDRRPETRTRCPGSKSGPRCVACQHEQPNRHVRPYRPGRNRGWR